MSITDRLRRWISNRINDGWDYPQAMDIADEIDKAHDKALNDCIHDPAIAADYWEAIIAERYIELPKDKNGKTIHVGDRMKLTNRISTFVVASITYIENGAVLVRPLDSGIAIPFKSSEIIEPDSQEKIDADAVELAGNVGVTMNAMRDLLRRQRELDGVK